MTTDLPLAEPGYVACRTCRDRRDLAKRLRKAQRRIEILERRLDREQANHQDTLGRLRQELQEQRTEYTSLHKEVVYLKRRVLPLRSEQMKHGSILRRGS